MSQGMSAIVWFLAIIAIIPVALWLLKRTPIGGGGSVHGLRVVATLSLAAHQRVVTVEVGQGDDRRWLVLGVTPQNITALHTLPPQGEASAATPQPVPFAQLLGRLRRDPGARDGH